jgi:hypothetical protein
MMSFFCPVPISEDGCPVIYGLVMERGVSVAATVGTHAKKPTFGVKFRVEDICGWAEGPREAGFECSMSVDCTVHEDAGIAQAEYGSPVLTRSE